jgi:hypothetical protein
VWRLQLVEQVPPGAVCTGFDGVTQCCQTLT